MRIHLSCVAITCLLASAHAQDILSISLGVRETVAGGSTITTIGANGGSAGSIEWVNKDGQALILDGTWQTFTFNFATDPIAGFTGDGVINGTHGVFEHLRILNSSGITDPITLLIDDVVDTTNTLGAVTVCDFDDSFTYGPGSEVMFQEASFSGSTSGNVNAGSATVVQNTFPHASWTSQVDFQFIDNSPIRWVRLTTFNCPNVPNPVVQFDDNSTVTLRILGFTKKQQNMGLAGPGTLVADFVGAGLNAGEISTLHVAGAPANGVGGAVISFYGFADLPIFGGMVLAGTGNFASALLLSDANGYVSLSLAGAPNLVDIAIQPLFLDPSLPQYVSFGPGFLAAFGR